MLTITVFLLHHQTKQEQFVMKCQNFNLDMLQGRCFVSKCLQMTLSVNMHNTVNNYPWVTQCLQCWMPFNTSSDTVTTHVSSDSVTVIFMYEAFSKIRHTKLNQTEQNFQMPLVTLKRLCKNQWLWFNCGVANEKGKEIISSLHIPGNFHCLVLELYMWVTQMKISNNFFTT